MQGTEAPSVRSPHLCASTLICLCCSIVAAQAQDHSRSGVNDQQFFRSLDQAVEMESAWRQILTISSLHDAATREALKNLKDSQTRRWPKGDFWKPGEFDRALGR